MWNGAAPILKAKPTSTMAAPASNSIVVPPSAAATTPGNDVVPVAP